MKQPIFAICFLFICAISASAQVTAITTDGKKVLLSSDGTWKYSDSQASGITLKIEAGLAYSTGPVPVARTPFILLDTDPTPELLKLPHTAAGDFDGLQQLSLSCRAPRPEATEVIQKFARHTLITGFDGKAQLTEIQPGKYWLHGITKTYTGSCVMWLLPIDLTKSQSVTLDQHNAVKFQ